MNATEVTTGTNGHESAHCPPIIDWLYLDDNDTPISTFLPIVEDLIEIRLPDDTVVNRLVRFRLDFQKVQSESIEFPISKIDRFPWEKCDIRCILNEPIRKTKKAICNLVRAGCTGIRPSVRYVAIKMGISHIDGAICFATGDEVILPTTLTQPHSSIEPPNLPYRLDIDPALSIEETFKGMQELVSLSPEIGRILVAHVISGITRCAFLEAGVNPRTVLVVVGKSGMFKSSYVPLLAQLYNREKGIAPTTRFNSTTRFIEDTLSEYSECTVVIDDLHTAESQSIKRKNEATAEEIIRRIGDNTGRGRMEGNTLVQKSFGGNAIFLCEYLIGIESTIPRALVVRLTQRPNGSILDKYQRGSRLLVSTFYHHFIQWYVDHYDEVVRKIDEEFTNFRKQEASDTVHGRLQDAYFYLRISYHLFLRFCEFSGCISEKDLYDENDSFSRQLMTLIKAQQNRFRPNDIRPKDINWLKQIRKFYRKKLFRLADDVYHFDTARHDSVIHDGCLCIRKDGFSRVLHDKFPNIKLNDVLNILIDQNALKRTSEKRTIQISALHGKRFYAIPLVFLKDD